MSYEKVDDMSYRLTDSVSKLLYKYTLPNFINTKIEAKIFSIKNNVIENLDKIKFDKDLIITPIYSSNNTILN